MCVCVYVCINDSNVHYIEGNKMLKVLNNTEEYIFYKILEHIDTNIISVLRATLLLVEEKKKSN